MAVGHRRRRPGARRRPAHRGRGRTDGGRPAAAGLGPARRAGPLPLHDLGPLTWEPVGLEGLLPRLDANIELGPLGEDRTQLAISARYQPPLGVVGHALDRVLLHRVAEATLKDFLDSA